MVKAEPCVREGGRGAHTGKTERMQARRMQQPSPKWGEKGKKERDDSTGASYSWKSYNLSISDPHALEGPMPPISAGLWRCC